MHIITTLPRYSDGQIHEAFLKEIKTGFQLEKETEKARELQAAEQSKGMKSDREIEGLGRAVGVIPEREYFRLIKKYGHAEVHSKGFMQYFQKKFPHLAPNRI